MLSYAPRPRHKASPGAIAAVVGLHAAAFTAVLLVKPDLVDMVTPTKTTVVNVPLPPEPPEPTPLPPEPTPPQSAPPIQYTVPTPKVALPALQGPAAPSFVADSVPLTNIAEVPLGPLVEPPAARPVPATPAIAPTAAALLTRGTDLEPPYPAAMQRRGEEAVLKLRLQVDARGRVTTVEVLNSVDPSFVRAAEKHIKARWRYEPATRDGAAVATQVTTTLRFRLQ